MKPPACPTSGVKPRGPRGSQQSVAKSGDSSPNPVLAQSPMSSQASRTARPSVPLSLSGWRDSNPRPPRPKRGALTKLRYSPSRQLHVVSDSTCTNTGAGTDKIRTHDLPLPKRTRYQAAPHPVLRSVVPTRSKLAPRLPRGPPRVQGKLGAPAEPGLVHEADPITTLTALAALTHRGSSTAAAGSTRRAGGRRVGSFRGLGRATEDGARATTLVRAARPGRADVAQW